MPGTVQQGMRTWADATIDGVELRQLRYFVTVAELLHFTRAARALRIAQPPLSRQIQSLEKELGVQLLERSPGKVVLTQSGAIFLEEARAVLKRAEKAIESARAASNGERGIVRMGIGMGLGDAVSRVINAHLALYPKVELDVVNIPSGYQSEALVSRTIDVGFLRPPVDESRITSAKIFSEHLSVVMPRSNPLARRAKLTLRQIAGETLLLIGRPVSSGVYDKTLTLFRERGLEPKIIQTESTPLDEAGAILVASGKGVYIAMGPDVVHPSFADRLAVVPLAEKEAFVEAHAAWRKNEGGRAVLNFIDYTKQYFDRRPVLNRDLRKRGTLSVPAEASRRRARR